MARPLAALLVPALLVPVVLALSAPLPAWAAPPQKAAVTAKESAHLRKAKALIDRMTRELERMAREVEAAGNDQARIAAVGEKFKRFGESIKAEGEAVNAKLTDDEKKQVEVYGRKKIQPLMGRLMGAMMKAHAAQAKKAAVPEPEAEDAPTEPVEDSQSPALKAVLGAVAQQAAEVRRLLGEANLTRDPMLVQSLAARLQALLQAAHAAGLSQRKVLSNEELAEVHAAETDKLARPLRMLRRVLARGGEPPCVHLQEARKKTEEWALALHQATQRGRRAQGSGTDEVEPAVKDLGARLEEVSDGKGTLLRLLDLDEREEVEDLFDEHLQPAQDAAVEVYQALQGGEDTP